MVSPKAAGNQLRDWRELGLNDTEPLIMHVDLNSCYATIEQQANRLLRGKPVGVAAYDSPGGFIVAASYEAKRRGVSLMRVAEARQLCPDIIILTPDPEKYFDAHRRLRAVLERYTSDVNPKSVDEFVLDFTGSPAIRAGQSLESVGRAIKADIRASLGEHVTVNIGIAPNRFLAKVAAGLDKPNGMNLIRAPDILNLYGQLDLMDLPGINRRYKTRLNLAHIFTPLDLLGTPMHTLKHQVFHSIVGYYWHLRLRGWEVDAARLATRSFGNDYAVGNKTADPDEILRLLMKLAEKTGRRLRAHGYQAHGATLAIGFENRTYWHKSRRTSHALYATQDIFKQLARLLSEANIDSKVVHLSIAVFNLAAADPVQLGLFDGTKLDTRSLAIAADAANDRYGEFTLVPASMAGMDKIIIKRVPFGSVRDL